MGKELSGGEPEPRRGRRGHQRGARPREKGAKIRGHARRDVRSKRRLHERIDAEHAERAPGLARRDGVPFHHRRGRDHAEVAPQRDVDRFVEPGGSAHHVIGRAPRDTLTGECKRATRALVGEIDGNDDRHSHRDPQHRQST